MEKKIVTALHSEVPNACATHAARRAKFFVIFIRIEVFYCIEKYDSDCGDEYYFFFFFFFGSHCRLSSALTLMVDSCGVSFFLCPYITVDTK